MFADPGKLVVISGAGQSHLEGNALNGALSRAFQVLTIDLGGNDHYTSSAGGADGVGLLQASTTESDIQQSVGAVSLAVDLGGDDTYIGVMGVQGSAQNGIGILLELGGNDAYNAVELSQGGVALGGVALLFDAFGSDRYTSSWSSQGYAAGPALAINLDLGGNEFYHTDFISQGFGYQGGKGAYLLNVAGDDRYEAMAIGPDDSQGASDLQGIGVFADGAGDDTFTLSAEGRGWVCTCGLTNMVGVGLFFDGGGTDSYEPSNIGGNGQVWQDGWAGFGLDVG
jgi:hypothetical protein